MRLPGRLPARPVSALRLLSWSPFSRRRRTAWCSAWPGTPPTPGSEGTTGTRRTCSPGLTGPPGTRPTPTGKPTSPTMAGPGSTACPRGLTRGGTTLCAARPSSLSVRGRTVIRPRGQTTEPAAARLPGPAPWTQANVTSEEPPRPTTTPPRLPARRSPPSWPA